jgi:hypothetical protein
MITRNNWLDMSWDGLPARVNKENLRMVFKEKTTRILPFEKALLHTAEEIYSLHKNLYLAFSGGADSEIIADAFVKLGIPFQPVFLYFVNQGQVFGYDAEEDELGYVTDWCKNNNIEPIIIKKEINDCVEYYRTAFRQLKPRIPYSLNMGIIVDYVDQQGGTLITGNQLEYYPDREQMTYLEPCLGSYQGFVCEESDFYVEMFSPNRHPYSFHYWSPDILASFVNEWNPTKTMSENKSLIYKNKHRPKMLNSVHQRYLPAYIEKLACKFGTLDCALLGTKEELLSKLVK